MNALAPFRTAVVAPLVLPIDPDSSRTSTTFKAQSAVRFSTGFGTGVRIVILGGLVFAESGISLPLQPLVA